MLNFDDIETYKYKLLLKVSKPHSVDPSSSIEADEYFKKLLSSYTGDNDQSAIIDWLDRQIAERFIAIGDRPRWIQDPGWPFANNEPLIFVGQIDVSAKDNKVVSSLYHNDTSLYVFIGRNTKPVVVIQQY
ncbi:MAG: hypothetical protein J2P21_01145 [Chloracidobacterium sp.]|nr:hypothetical protein [Chloracidobacterium sp.]